jgi:hypothetical protein
MQRIRRPDHEQQPEDTPRAPPPAPHPAAAVLALQRTMGNQAVQRALLARTDDLETTQTFKPKGKQAFGQRPSEFGPVKIEFEDILQPKGKVVRPVKVSGLVYPQSTGQRPGAPEPISGVHVSEAKAGQPKVGAHGENARNQGLADAQKGHIMALELGGPDIPQNIVPQWANWQSNGVWRRMEKHVYDLAQAAMANGHHLHFTAELHYKQYGNGWERYASRKSVGTPRAFTVTVVEVDGTGQPVAKGIQEIPFADEQRQDKTDDMMFMRTLQALSEKGGQPFEYPDWDPKAKKEKAKKGKAPAFKGGWRDNTPSPFAAHEAQMRERRAAEDSDWNEYREGFRDGYDYVFEDADTAAYLRGYEEGRDAYLEDYQRGFLDGFNGERAQGEGEGYYEGVEDGKDRREQTAMDEDT